MNKLRYFAAAVLLTLLFCSCDEPKKTDVAAKLNIEKEFPRDYITVGTFNLQWLGDGTKDRIKRRSEHYKAIAKIINDTEADILALQEIENEKAVKRLLKYLPDYDFIIGENGGAQKLAVIYKKDISVADYGEYFPVMVEKGRTKPGLWLYVRAGNFDFHFMNVHFKSSSRWDNTAQKRAESLYLRKSQAIAALDWADSLLRDSDELDIIIAGDFNDTPRRKKNRTLDELQELLWFITGDMKSCKYPSAYTIDHVICSDIAGDRFIQDSEFMDNTFSKYSKEELKMISDHCPVTVKFDVTAPDNDPVKPVAVK